MLVQCTVLCTVVYHIVLYHVYSIALYHTAPTQHTRSCTAGCTANVVLFYFVTRQTRIIPMSYTATQGRTAPQWKAGLSSQKRQHPLRLPLSVPSNVVLQQHSSAFCVDGQASTQTEQHEVSREWNWLANSSQRKEKDERKLGKKNN